MALVVVRLRPEPFPPRKDGLRPLRRRAERYAQNTMNRRFPLNSSRVRSHKGAMREQRVESSIVQRFDDADVVERDTETSSMVAGYGCGERSTGISSARLVMKESLGFRNSAALSRVRSVLLGQHEPLDSILSGFRRGNRNFATAGLAGVLPVKQTTWFSL